MRRRLTHLIGRRMPSTGCDALRCLSVRRAIERGVDDPNVTVDGWVDSIRKISRKLTFVHMYDGLSDDKLQVILTAPLDTALIKQVSLGACVSVRGRMQTTKAKETNGVELVADDVIVHAHTDDDHPFYRRKMTTYDDAYLRRFPHLRAVEPHFARTMRARHCGMRAVHDYFETDEFVHIQTPVITSNDCEGGSEVFLVESDAILSGAALPSSLDEDRHYFDSRTFLTVSGQLHLEAMSCGIARTYTLSPTFRAESNDTRQHLAEFHMIEAEMAFARNLDTLLETVESLVVHVATALENGHYSSPSTIDPVLERGYACITHADAVRDLRASGEAFMREPSVDMRLHKEHEWALLRANDDRPLFITHHNASTCAFYTARDGDRALSFDLIMPRCAEVAGGSMRETSHDRLAERVHAMNDETRERLRWYVALRAYGYGPMGGFGVGFDRLLQSLLDVPNVRDTLPFPRVTHSCPM